MLPDRLRNGDHSNATGSWITAMLLYTHLLISSLALGAAYALVALGFLLVLNATSAVNFAHGDLVMAGGMVTAVMAQSLPPLPAIVLLPAVLALMAAVGLLLCLVAYWPLRHRPPASVFISTIAVGIILENGALVAVGPEPQTAPALLGGGYMRLGSMVVAEQSLAMLAVAAALIGATALMLGRTQLGRKLRATAQDPEMARACGVNTGAMIFLTFALGSVLAGAAGLMLAHQFFVTPDEGALLIVKAYIAVTIGGWGSIGGAVLGALLIAVFETFVAVWLSYPVATGLLYLALLAILAVRPQGLFGEAIGRRA